MNKTHEFYPMITGTVRTIISLATDQEKPFILHILRYYPNFTATTDDMKHISNICKELLNELDRQYSRWNKGGLNG